MGRAAFYRELTEYQERILLLFKEAKTELLETGFVLLTSGLDAITRWDKDEDMNMPRH